MDIPNYDRETLEHFEIIASSIVDVFYNNIYNNAKTQQNTGRSGRATSITENYKELIDIFVKRLNSNSEFFMGTLNKIFDDYHRLMRFSSITYTDFLQLIIKCFIPEEYLGSLRSEEGDKIITKIFQSSISEFAVQMVELENLRKVIDTRGNIVDVSYFRDKFIEILKNHREALYSRFMRQANNIREQEVPLSVANKLKDAVVQLGEENKQLKVKIRESESLIANLRSQIHKLERAAERDFLEKSRADVSARSVKSSHTRSTRSSRSSRTAASQASDNSEASSAGIILSQRGVTTRPRKDKEESEDSLSSDSDSGSDSASDSDKSEDSQPVKKPLPRRVKTRKIVNSEMPLEDPPPPPPSDNNSITSSAWDSTTNYTVDSDDDFEIASRVSSRSSQS